MLGNKCFFRDVTTYSHTKRSKKPDIKSASANGKQKRTKRKISYALILYKVQALGEHIMVYLCTKMLSIVKR